MLTANQKVVFTCLEALRVCVCVPIPAFVEVMVVCVPVIIDDICQIYSFCVRKKKNKINKMKSWFLSFANTTDTLENFCLLSVPYHLAGRRTAAELNYMLPHRWAQLNSIT